MLMNTFSLSDRYFIYLAIFEKKRIHRILIEPFFYDCDAYSHLSNKREVTLTDFEKFHPPQKRIPPPHLLISMQNFPIFLKVPDDDFSHSHFEL